MSIDSNARKIGWPENTYIINQRYRFIYCPIPKNACTSFKKLAVQLTGSQEPSGLNGPEFHMYVQNNLTLAAYNTQPGFELDKVLVSDEYFRFVIVRNPWHRLVASYLDKFVRNRNPEKYALDVMEAIYKSQGVNPNYQTSVTFEQFINYINVTEDKALNPHWKPQHLFLVKNEFDFVGRVENLAEDFKLIKQRLNLPVELSRKNKTEYDSSQPSNHQDYFKMYPSDLRKMKSYPRYQEFYNERLLEIVRNRYKRDIETFEYDF